MNVTVVPQGPLGFLTLWPDGIARPTVSTLNAPTGTVVANAAIAQGGAASPGLNGAMNVYMTEPSHVIVDLNGYFAPPGLTGELAFYPVTPCRLVDTRFTGGALAALETRDFNVPAVTACAIPTGALAYSVNATVVPPGIFGYLTLWTTLESTPVVSTLNAVDGALTSNAAIVPVNAGVIRAFVPNATHLLLDIGGYFAP